MLLTSHVPSLSRVSDSLSQRRGNGPSPLILGFWKTFVQPVGRTRQIHIRSDCRVTPCFTSSIQIKTHPKGVPSRRLLVTTCVLFILIVFLLSSLTPHFSFLMFSYISLASYPFFPYFLHSPNLYIYIYIYIYICVQHRFFVRIWIQRVEHR